MLESEMLSIVVRKLRARLGREAVIFKHSDRMIRGIPDLSITTRGHTVWAEGKMVLSGAVKVDPYQSEMMRRLESAGYRAIFIIGYVDPRQKLRLISDTYSNVIGMKVSVNFPINTQFDDDLNKLIDLVLD